MMLVLQLLLAHVIGDFLLQPHQWVLHKRKDKLKSPYFYVHILIHALVLFIIFQFQLKYWLAIVISIISHFIIDYFKLLLENKINEKALFLLDQAAHILIIGWIVLIYQNIEINLDNLWRPQTLLFVLAVLCITTVSSVLMKIIMNSWSIEEDDYSDSLKNAGKYIGILERLFVFLFIILNQWQAIGFLIAAKSVFRFGDLSRSKDRKLTEYILIGTLLSFGLALAIGLGYVYLSKTMAS